MRLEIYSADAFIQMDKDMCIRHSFDKRKAIFFNRELKENEEVGQTRWADRARSFLSSQNNKSKAPKEKSCLVQLRIGTYLNAAGVQGQRCRGEGQ